MLKILLTLYHELCQRNLPTLNEYVVNVRGVQVQKPNDELSFYILEIMCQQQLML